MMRSLNSGVSGLSVHQTKMDVIGNNIANVNTVGFKASKVNFADVFYQTTQSATGPNAETGAAGRNALQIGMGTNVASITKSIEQTGGTQRTDNPFDVKINGRSFFIVNSGGSNYFTKAGAFGIDGSGNLSTPDGALVMGWQVDRLDPTKTIADTVSPLRIMSAENLFASPVATTHVNISGNIDSKDSQIASETGKAVSISFFDNLGYSYSGQIKIQQMEGTENEYSINLMDITNEVGNSIFANKIVDENGLTTFEPSDIRTFNFGGYTYEVELDTNNGQVSMHQIEVDGDGNPILDADDNFVRVDPQTPPRLIFNKEDGSFSGVLGSDNDLLNGLDLAINQQNGAFEDINIDFSSLTMYSTNGNSSLEAAKGSLEGIGAGRQVGNLSGIGIDASGKIYGRYDNGDSRLLGQIAVASFSNPAGLEAVGNNLFAQTQNSGEFDGIGQEVTQDGGSFTTGALEMSNVDLASEFTDMITTQRGFQANSRIITVSDTLLEELINLKR
ncbi:MAG: flagellar hook protein FlgE [Clostridiales bacterium]|nr:flagellar hook protein FlgE [Clostridiales bacterium]